MDFQVKSDPQLSYLSVKLCGIFDVVDLEKCYRAVIGRSDWKEGTDILWDVRACSFGHLTQGDIRNIAVMTGKYRDRRGPGRAAWVVGRDVDYGIGRMFEMINESRVIFNFRVFRTIDAAKGWISGNA